LVYDQPALLTQDNDEGLEAGILLKYKPVATNIVGKAL
jgi:hypothetical protein